MGVFKWRMQEICWQRSLKEEGSGPTLEIMQMETIPEIDVQKKNVLGSHILHFQWK